MTRSVTSFVSSDSETTDYPFVFIIIVDYTFFHNLHFLLFYPFPLSRTTIIYSSLTLNNTGSFWRCFSTVNTTPLSCLKSIPCSLIGHVFGTSPLYITRYLVFTSNDFISFPPTLSTHCSQPITRVWYFPTYQISS